MDSRFDDTRIEIEKEEREKIAPGVDLDKRDIHEINSFYQEERGYLMKPSIDPAYNNLIIDAYSKLEKDGRLTKDVSSADFAAIQVERLSKAPEVRSVEGDSTQERMYNMYAEKMSVPGLHASPALAYGLRDGDKDEARDDKYARVSIGAFIKTLTPEEKDMLIPRTADESREYTYMPINDDGRYEFVSRSLTGAANVNQEMMDKLAETLRIESGKENPICVEAFAGNGVLSYEFQQRGISSIPTDIHGNEYNPYYNIADSRYTNVLPLDASEAMREYGRDADYIIVSWPPYNDRAAADMVETLRDVNSDAKLIFIGEREGGMCADDRFFEQLKEVDSEGIRETDALHISLPGMEDGIYMFEIDQREGA